MKLPEDKQNAQSAESPAQMPASAWKNVLVRTWAEAAKDNVGLVAAGTSFYCFLALVPLLGSVVLTYGLVADVQTVGDHIAGLVAVLPAEAAKLIGEQLIAVVQGSSEKKGFGLLIALGVALFGARNAAGALITALNIAYEEEEKRGFIRVNLLALGITAAGVLAAVAGILAVAALNYLHLAVPQGSPVLIAAGRVVSFILVALAAAGMAALLYRYGPSRQNARWRWLTPGSALFAVSLVLLTLGFGFYASNFGSYGATYGTLSSVVVLLTWIYLSAYALLFGAELNSELEHQTARDTTTGPERPLGQRGAWAADTVAEDG
jgi:membrane protein